MIKKKRNLIILLFIAGFFSLAILGFAGKQSEDSITVNKDNVEKVINKDFETPPQINDIEDNKKDNILDLKDKVGSGP